MSNFIEMPFQISRVDEHAIYLRPVQPRPEVRVVAENQKPSDEMRKWLLEGHKNDKEKTLS